MRLPLLLRHWLFQLDRTEQIPIRLTQRRIFILPTRLGLLYASVLVVMYLGAVNYNLGLGHLLVFLLVSLGGVGMVQTFRNLYHLEVRPGRAEPVFAGEPAHFTLLIRNPGPTLRPAIAINAGPLVEQTFDLPASAASSIVLSLPTTRRGWMPLPPLTLASRYPLGIFRAWSYPRPSMRCLVYPRPLPTPLPPPRHAAHPGNRSQATGDEDFSGLRPHQDGESLRHVAWKTYARAPDHEPLLTKQFSGGIASELWLDIALLPPGADLEHRLSLLCGWVIGAEAQGHRYGLRLFETELPPDSGPRHAARCLEALALAGSPDDVAVSH